MPTNDPPAVPLTVGVNLRPSEQMTVNGLSAVTAVGEYAGYSRITVGVGKVTLQLGVRLTVTVKLLVVVAAWAMVAPAGVPSSATAKPNVKPATPTSRLLRP